MDTLTIVLLTVVIALLAGALAWFGPRRRHWQTHPGTRLDDRPVSGTGDGDEPTDHREKG